MHGCPTGEYPYRAFTRSLNPHSSNDTNVRPSSTALMYAFLYSAIRSGVASLLVPLVLTRFLLSLSFF